MAGKPMGTGAHNGGDALLAGAAPIAQCKVPGPPLWEMHL